MPRDLKEVNCHACGTVTMLRENKNGMAYYFCPKESCKHHERYGRENSELIISEIDREQEVTPVDEKQGIEANEQDYRPDSGIVEVEAHDEIRKTGIEASIQEHKQNANDSNPYLFGA